MAVFLPLGTFLMSGVGVVMLSVYVHFHGEWPTYSDVGRVMLLASTAVPLGVAGAAVVRYTTSPIPGTKRVCSLFLFFLVAAVCVLLSSPEALTPLMEDALSYTVVGWRAHLFLLLALYALFIIWDFLFLFGSDAIVQEFRAEALNSFLFLNFPTFLTFVALWFFIAEWEFRCSEDIIYFADKRIGFETIFDLFVAGIISFHLAVGAFIFVIATFSTRVRSGDFVSGIKGRWASTTEAAHKVREWINKWRR